MFEWKFFIIINITGVIFFVCVILFFIFFIFIFILCNFYIIDYSSESEFLGGGVLFATRKNNAYRQQGVGDVLNTKEFKALDEPSKKLLKDIL